MRKQMLVVNLVLLAAVLGLAWKLQADWKRGAQRSAALSAATIRQSGTLSAPALVPQGGIAGSEIIASGNLFSADRNNDAPKVSERKPPPEPVLVGTMNLGPGRKLALMSDANPRADAMPRQVKEGETFGGYRLLSIGDNEVEIEFQGQKIKVEVSTSAQQVPAPATVAASASSPQVVSTAGASPATAPSNVTNTIPVGAKEGPTNIPIEGTNSVFGYNDNLPAGTIRGNRRKVVRVTPFGSKEAWWELIKPDEKKPEERKPQ